MNRPRSKIAITFILMAAVIAAWLWLRHSHRDAGNEPRTAAAARPERPQTVRLPVATISPDTEHSRSGFGGRVVSAETGQPVPRASLTFVLAGAAIGTTGDDDGKFVVQGATPGTYELVSATAEGFLPFDAQTASGAVLVTTRPDLRVDDVTIYLTPAAKWTVAVEDPSHKPIAGAEVRVLSWHGVSSEPIATDARGEAELVAEPDQRLDVRKAGFLRGIAEFTRTMRQRRVVVTLQPGQEPPLLAISGRALDSAGAPVDGAVVEAYSTAPGVLRRSAIALTGADGSFALTDLGPERYRVRATTPHQGSAERKDVAAGTTGVELKLGRPEVGIRGTVRDAANQPVPAFAVVATPRDGALVRGNPVRAAVIDPLGRYFLALPPGSYAVSAAASGHAPSAETTVEVSDAVVDVDLTLPGGSRIFGRVVERGGGAAIPGAYVNLAIPSAAAGIAFASSATSGHDGAFSFDGLRPGRTSIVVQASGHNGRVLGGLDVPEDRPLGPLVVDLANAEPGKEAMEFVGIAARLEPTESALRIGGVLPGGGASDAGLLAGDMIVAVDGRSVQDLGTSTAVEALRGPENTIVMLAVKRASGTTSNIPVTRKHVELR